jgi:dUTP pyrophosphatase
MIKVKIQKINEDAVIPEYAHDTDAGMDLFATKGYMLLPNHRVLVGTGLKMEIPKGYEMQIRPKSGLAIREGITVLNTPGTIDADYRGEVGVVLINHSSKPYKIEKGQKIAQAIFNKIEKAKFVSEKLSETKRGDGGFGSTGLIRTNF